MESKKLNKHYKSINEINGIIDNQLNEFVGPLVRGGAKKAIKYGPQALKWARTNLAQIGFFTNRTLKNQARKNRIKELEADAESAEGKELIALGVTLKGLLDQLQRSYSSYTGSNAIAGQGYDIDGVGGDEYTIPYDTVILDLVGRMPTLKVTKGGNKEKKYKVSGNRRYNIIAIKQTPDGYILNLTSKDMPFDSMLAYVQNLKDGKTQRIMLQAIDNNYSSPATQLDGKLVSFK